jgi:phosphatidylserine/phosphatidylglycerophosphate/cardiolipin synthase-like enzyme
VARAAKDAGITDAEVIADIIFFKLHPERMSAGVGKLIARDEPDFSKLRAEWEQHLVIAERLLRPSAAPSVFLPALAGRKYDDFVAKPTTGKVTMFVHGRNSDGTGKFDPQKNSWSGGFRDLLETYERMRETVEALRAGDTLYIASWRFQPQGVPIPAGASSLARTWEDLLKEKAIEGIKIRVIIANHSPFSPFKTDLSPVDTSILSIPAPKRDHFKYILSRHPDLLVVGLHHQKFIVAKRGKSTVAYCGGLDIADGRVSRNWWYRFVWHDVVAKLEGRIAYDLERHFVDLWNRDRNQLTVAPLAGWKPFEKLAAASPGGDDQAGALNPHPVQMLRTVSNGSQDLSDIRRLDLRRDDIWRGYFRLIGRARRFIYLENAYFHEPKLAEAIVRQVQSQPGMIVMVVVSTGTDDPKASPFTKNMRARRLEFFQRLKPLGQAHLRVYTVQYEDGLLHTKLALVDDEALTVGSANANPRGFFFDTEVNFMLDHAETVRGFRHRLWAHNLGVDEGEVARWPVGDFFRKWDAVANANGRFDTPVKMTGEGVRALDPTNPKAWRFDAGQRQPVGPISDPPDFWF